MATTDLAIYQSVGGSFLTVTPTLLTWDEVTVIFNEPELANAAPFTSANPGAAPSFPLLQAYNNNSMDLVRVGDFHEFYGNTYCIRCVLRPYNDRDGTAHLCEVVTYAQPGQFCSVSYATYQQTEERTFAEDPTNPNGMPTTNITTVEFAFGGLTYSVGSIGPTPSGIPTGAPTGALQGPTTSQVPPVVRVRVPTKLKAMRVTQWEALTGNDAVPSVIMDSDRPFWNDDPIWGYDPGELLFIGVDSTTEGTPLHQRTYTYLVNQYGWHHFFEIWVDSRGLANPTIVPINPGEVKPTDGTVKRNGAAAFRMLPSQIFANVFSGIKKPFNVGFVQNPKSNGSGSADAQGDFFPMPGNFA